MMFGQVRARGRSKSRGLFVNQYPKFPYLIEGFNAISSFTPTNPSYTWGAVKNNDGKYYFGAMAKAINNRDPLIYKFQPFTNNKESGFRINVGVSPLNADTHRIPNMDIDSSGNLYVVFELLSATEGHGSSILLYKTTTPYDITTLTVIKTLSGRWSYPFIKISGNNVFICARGTTSTVNFIRGEQWYWFSTDLGANFGAPVQLYASGDEQKVSYCWAQHDYNGGISIVLNERDNDLSNWTFVSMIRGTFNSNVWTNVGQTVSKDVSSVAAFTRAEMMSDNLVMQSSNFTTIAVNHEGGIIKSDGSIKMLVSVQTLTGNTFAGNPESQLDELRLYTFSGGSWSFENVDIPVSPIVFYWAYERYWMLMNNDAAYDDILFIDPTVNHNMYMKRSTDGFATEISRLQLVGNDRWRLGAQAFNADALDEYLVILTDTQGDLFEIENEGPEDFSNLVVFQNFAMP